MHLPSELKEAIALEAERFKLQEILTARSDLTNRYRNQGDNKGSLIGTEAERCAYVISRLPATFSVIYRVLQELQKITEDSSIHSILDLGAGPGTVMWAANEILSNIQSYSLVEQDKSLMNIGKRLIESANPSLGPNVNWYLQNMENLEGMDAHDVVTFSYSAGELSHNTIRLQIERCWQLTRKYLIVIEPGTPRGFELIRMVRSQLIELGGFIVAPCSHAKTCPMINDNWCHFSQRVERSFLHRKIKKGTLGYEDEKFSYIIVSKGACLLPQGRVLRHPQKHTGHVTLETCTAEGLKQQLISKRTPEEYKRARKLEWGSAIESREKYAE